MQRREGVKWIESNCLNAKFILHRRNHRSTKYIQMDTQIIWGSEVNSDRPLSDKLLSSASSSASAISNSLYSSIPSDCTVINAQLWFSQRKTLKWIQIKNDREAGSKEKFTKNKVCRLKNPTSKSSLLDPARLKWQFKPSRSTTFNQNQLTQKNAHRLWPPATCAKWYCNASGCLMQCSRPARHAGTTWPSWGYILKMKWLKGFQSNPCGTELKLQILQTDGPCS